MHYEETYTTICRVTFNGACFHEGDIGFMHFLPRYSARLTLWESVYRLEYMRNE